MNKNYFQIQHLSKVILLLIIISSAIIFFYHLSYGSLQSFDEAWYGSIAKQLLLGKQPLEMHYNQKVYIDHPPLILWLMAISYKIFGISEFSTRVVAAITGIGCIWLIYLIGAQLVNKMAGLTSAVMLESCLWFGLRARSGNLDIPFLFFYLLTIYLAILSRKNSKYLVGTAIAYGCLFLTKTLIGSSALILIVLLNYQHFWPLSKKSILKIFQYLGISLIIILPWYIYNSLINPNFLVSHFFRTGFRERTLNNFIDLNLSQVALYLQSGIGKWYKLFIISIPLLLINKNILRKKCLFLLAWLAIIGLPFVTTKETQVWHLIPLYPPIILITTLSIFSTTTYIRDWLQRYIPQFSQLKYKKILPLFTTVTFFLLAIWQLNAVYKLIIPNSNQVTAEADIASKAKKYNGELHLKSWFLPTAVFYSDKHIDPIYYRQDSYPAMVKLLTEENNTDLFIIDQPDLNTLETEHIKHQILEKNHMYFLISK